MDCYPTPITCRVKAFRLSSTSRRLAVVCLMAIATIAFSSGNAYAQRQIRSKKPDRGVYQPPTMPVSASAANVTAPRQRGEQIVDADAVDARTGTRANVRQVNFNDPVLQPPYIDGEIHGSQIHSGQINSDQMHGGVIVDTYQPSYDGSNTTDISVGEVGCGVETLGCDSLGCDAIGGCSNRNCGRCLPSPNGYVSFSPDRWFGSVELLLMYRRGDRPPALVTTGPTTDADTTGEIGQAGTQVLVGGQPIFKDATAGGRLTLGTWLDNQQNRSLIFRGWFAGEKTFGFVRDQDSLTVITRPFEDVSDNQAAAQDTLLVAFPDRATGSISVRGDSNVYGGDVSVRQFWYGIEGLSIDFLYGYQFMRLDENLAISSTSVSLDDDFAPLGSTIAISDSFDIENEFHGGQVGIASMYREGYWSFSALAKVAFGSLARTGDLQGQTRTSVDGITSVDSQGLLVRDINEGKRTDHTFGWVPEIDLSLGWRKFPNYEITVGYHVTAMSDALQVSGAIDPNLSVNLSDPPTGRQSPRASFDYRTFYVQGIHFGLQYVY